MPPRRLQIQPLNHLKNDSSVIAIIGTYEETLSLFHSCLVHALGLGNALACT